MFYLRNIIFAAGVVLASALLLQDAAVADPPDWAPAHGYRNKHHKNHKNHKHHKHTDKHRRYQHDYDEDDYSEDEDEHDARYGYHRDRDWQRDAYRDNRPYRRPAYRPRTVDQPIFVNGECTPKKATGAEAGAALGGALGAQLGSGNALATVAGTLAGAMLGSRADAAVTTSADEDCFRQVLESATDQEQVAWDNDGSSTHYELTPVRSYQRSGRACRELVTEIERQGEVREVYQTACRDPDGRWRIMD
ncbi:MAG: RT0821/Lpp0805 family surface protein [Gammaproteobacteria bacterium]